LDYLIDLNSAENSVKAASFYSWYD